MTYSTSAYPYDSVVYILTDIDGAWFQGSGVIIGPHTVLTAAHMVWDQDLGAAASQVRVFPGYSMGGAMISGPSDMHYNAVDDAGGEMNRATSQSDFAVIDFAQDLTSDGQFAIDPNYGGGSVHLTGYPGTANGSQTDTIAAVTKDAFYSVFNYSEGTISPGASGGPIWVNLGTMSNPEPSLAGLVSTSGWGVQITSADWSQIQGWISQDSALWNSNVRPTPFDFNGDHVADLGFLDPATGAWGYMALSNSGVGESWHAIGQSIPGYVEVAKGDFNGDGVSDVALRNMTTGDWGYMALNNSGAGEIWHPIGPSSTAYDVIGAGDFNGDGVADLAFRNRTNGDWGYMALNTTGSGFAWHGIGPSSTAYAAAAVGDFNGDGVSDVAFRDIATGDWGYMALNTSGVGEAWRPIGPSSTAYDVIGAGDFNGDGVADLAFRNNTTGDWGYMALNNSGAGYAWHAVGPSSPAYAAVATGDFNGDGITDVAFRNTSTGDWGYMALNASGVGETWHAIGPSSTSYSAF